MSPNDPVACPGPGPDSTLNDSSDNETGAKLAPGAQWGHSVFLLALAAAFFIIYFDYFLLDKYFSGSDFIRQQVPLINFESDCISDGEMPMWNPFILFGVPWVSSYMNSSLLPTHLLISLYTRLNLDIIQIEFLLWMLAGGIGAYFCAVELGAGRVASFLAASGFVFSGQMSALPVWGHNVINASCFTFMTLGYLRAMRTERIFSPMTAFFTAFSIFGGYISSVVMGLYILGFYILLHGLKHKRLMQSVKFIVLTFGVAFLIALPKLLPLYLDIHTSTRLIAEPNRSAYFGYFYFNDLPNMLIPVKYFFSFFAGGAVVLGLFHALFRKVAGLPAELLATLFGLALLMMSPEGQYTMPREVANSILPFMKNIRLDYQFLIYPLLFMVLFASRHIDGLLAERGRSAKLMSAMVCIAVMSAVFFAMYDTEAYWEAYCFHVAMVALWTIAFLGIRYPRAQALMAIALVILEAGTVISRTSQDFTPDRHEETMIMKIYDQIGAVHSFMDAASSKNESSMLAFIDHDHDRPRMDAASLNPDVVLIPFLSSSTGNALNKKRFAGIWYYTQKSMAQDELLFDTEFLFSIANSPFYSFSAESESVPAGSSAFTGISCSGFDFDLDSQGGGTFQLRQMHDERWSVAVDGGGFGPVAKDAHSFMNVPVDAGRHQLRFRFRDRRFELALGVGIIAALASLVWLIANILRARKKHIKRAI